MMPFKTAAARRDQRMAVGIGTRLGNVTLQIGRDWVVGFKEVMRWTAPSGIVCQTRSC